MSKLTPQTFLPIISCKLTLVILTISVAIFVFILILCHPARPLYYQDVRLPPTSAFNFSSGTSYSTPPLAEWKFDEKTATASHDTKSQTSADTRTTSSAASGNSSLGIYSSALNYDDTNDCVTTPEPSLCTDGSSCILSLGSGNTPHNNQWHHLVMSWDNTNLYHYLDGKYSTSISGPKATNHNRGSYIDAADAASGLTDFSISTNLIVEDIKIYNHSLSIAQIKPVYNGRVAVRFSPSEGSS